MDAAPAFGETATRVSGRRYLAHLVDGTLYLILFWTTILVADVALPGSGVESVLFVVVLVLALTVGHVWFLVLLHGRSGRSPGKRMVRLRVVDAAGQPPSREQMWKRSVPAIVEYLYLIAWLGMMTSPYRQRLGDRWANTYVVAG